jgi:hypothetical protein
MLISMNHWNWWTACLALFLLASPAPAQTTKLPDFSVPEGMVRRDFPLGMADLTTVEELCKETISQGGKYHILRSVRTLRVIAPPGEVETIREMLAHLTQPPPNVRIEFLARSVRDDSTRGFDARVRGPLPRGGAIEVDALNQQNQGSSLNRQFILVQSGKEGFIEIARDVPMVDFFTRCVADGLYGAVLGVSPFVTGNPNLIILATAHFEVPQIRWEKEGTRLLVHPVVEGNLIHLTVMPQISAVTIVDPEVFRQRRLNTYLTGREQYVTYTHLATTVTVQSGQEIQIGGFNKAEPEFSRSFFGASQSHSTGSGTFTVRATIQ